MALAIGYFFITHIDPDLGAMPTELGLDKVSAELQVVLGGHSVHHPAKVRSPVRVILELHCVRLALGVHPVRVVEAVQQAVERETFVELLAVSQLVLDDAFVPTVPVFRPDDAEKAHRVSILPALKRLFSPRNIGVGINPKIFRNSTFFI